MQKVIVATEQDGLDVITLVMLFEVPNEEFDLEDAVRKASVDYCKTKDGADVFEENCNCFNWGDFYTYVPNSFCEKYGFSIIKSFETIDVYFDEQLVSETNLEIEE